ncbi:MAG: threonine synthase [Nitrososphaerota archaeon]
MATEVARWSGLIKRIRLVCRNCSEEYESRLLYACPKCLGALEVKYEVSGMSKSTFESRKRSIWRYFELLPIEDPSNVVDIGSGNTPLVKADRLGEELGIRELYIKNDTLNPTFSFKDRPASVAVSKAKEFRLVAVGCASTGNLASATAAHATKAGLPCYVFMPSDVERNKILQVTQYGAEVVLVNGTYDDVNRLAHVSCDLYDVGIVNVNLRPYYVEGSKTMMLEIVEQLGWRAPEHVIVPMASGALLCALHKGLKEIEELGMVKGSTRMSGAQPEGCSPIVDAFKKGLDYVIPVERPTTLVKSLAIGMPGDGAFALKTVRQSGGVCESVSDGEALYAASLLAKTEGIFAEPGGAITVAVLKKLLEDGKVDRSEEVVCCVTGAGFKATEHISQQDVRTKLISPKIEMLNTIFAR